VRQNLQYFEPILVFFLSIDYRQDGNKLLVENLVAYRADVQGVFGQGRKHSTSMSPFMNLNW
jgi:hypothetical protein